jgi:hypothetical protein
MVTILETEDASQAAETISKSGWTHNANGISDLSGDRKQFFANAPLTISECTVSTKITFWYSTSDLCVKDQDVAMANDQIRILS